MLRNVAYLAFELASQTTVLSPLVPWPIRILEREASRQPANQWQTLLDHWKKQNKMSAQIVNGTTRSLWFRHLLLMATSPTSLIAKVRPNEQNKQTINCSAKHWRRSLLFTVKHKPLLYELPFICRFVPDAPGRVGVLVVVCLCWLYLLLVVSCPFYSWHLKRFVEHASDSEAEGNDSRSSQWTTGFSWSVPEN